MDGQHSPSAPSPLSMFAEGTEEIPQAYMKFLEAGGELAACKIVVDDTFSLPPTIPSTLYEAERHS